MAVVQPPCQDVTQVVCSINFQYQLHLLTSRKHPPLQKKFPNYTCQYFPFKDNMYVVELIPTSTNIIHYIRRNITAMILNLQMCTWITLPNSDRNDHYKTSHTHLRKRSISWASTLSPLLELMPLEVVGL